MQSVLTSINFDFDDGEEQRDAMMLALFCLAIQAALQEILARLPAGATISTYLDDIHLVSEPEDTAVFYSIGSERSWAGPVTLMSA